jgi:hypothetical protein
VAITAFSHASSPRAWATFYVLSNKHRRSSVHHKPLLRRPGNWHAKDEISVLRSCAETGINRFLMKGLLLFFIMCAASAHGLFASDSLPFPVSLGGQAAKDGVPFAKIENPVAADAELTVDSKSDMIIVNVNMVNAKNEPVPGSTPAVILLQGKTKTTIDKTMDGKSFPPESTS